MNLIIRVISSRLFCFIFVLHVLVFQPDSSRSGQVQQPKQSPYRRRFCTPFVVPASCVPPNPSASDSPPAHFSGVLTFASSRFSQHNSTHLPYVKKQAPPSISEAPVRLCPIVEAPGSYDYIRPPNSHVKALSSRLRSSCIGSAPQ